LLEAGYTNVLNAGGHDDIKAMKLPGQSVNWSKDWVLYKTEHDP
jgi:hypothetical protein